MPANLAVMIRQSAARVLRSFQVLPMSLPERHELPDGTPLYTGAGCPFDESGVDLTLVDAMLAMTPAERFGWLEDTLALAETLRSGLAKPSPGDPERP